MDRNTGYTNQPTGMGTTGSGMPMGSTYNTGTGLGATGMNDPLMGQTTTGMGMGMGPTSTTMGGTGMGMGPTTTGTTAMGTGSIGTREPSKISGTAHMIGGKTKGTSLVRTKRAWGGARRRYPRTATGP